MLVVGDVQRVAANHDTVAGAETVRDIGREIDLDLHCHMGRRGVLHGLLCEVVHIRFGSPQHLVRVQRAGLQLLQLRVEFSRGQDSEFLAGVQLADGVCQSAFLRIGACPVRKVLLEMRCRRTSQPAVGAGCAQKGVLSGGRHCPTSR